MVRDLSRLRMHMNSYTPLQKAYEMAVRQNELYEAMQIVESCGASVELTKAVTLLGNRLRSIQGNMESAVQSAIVWDWDR